LHYRNLIDFLGNKKERKDGTNLRVWNIWKRIGVPEPQEIARVRAQGEQLRKIYEQVAGSISRYLQHCTTFRTSFKRWPVGKMNSELEIVLSKIENALRRDDDLLWGREYPVLFLIESSSTASPASLLD
jgi:hypothetical protein